MASKYPTSDMERWSGKVAIVTGASSGIGWSIVKDLLSANMLVVGLARRLEKMEELRTQLDDEQQKKAFQPIECDISSLASLTNAFQTIEQQYKCINVLINNAGMAEITKLLDEGNEAALKRVIDLNLMGTVNCTKQAYRLMKLAMDEGEECHIITVNSLVGHTVPLHIPECGLNLYPVAKHALRATNEILRRELFEHKLMRLSSISPGLTETNFASNANTSESKDWEKLDIPEKILQSEDVARGITFILASPLHVTIADLIMVPSDTKNGSKMCNQLIARNTIVIGVSNYLGPMQSFRLQLQPENREHFYTFDCDFRSGISIRNTILQIEKQFNGAEFMIYPELETFEGANFHGVKEFHKIASKLLLKNKPFLMETKTFLIQFQ